MFPIDVLKLRLQSADMSGTKMTVPVRLGGQVYDRLIDMPSLDEVDIPLRLL